MIRDERGFVGGFEVLPFGFLVFVAGSLLLTNAWAVIDGKLAASAAAREATRAYVEAPSGDDADRLATDAALATVDGHGHDPARASVVWVEGGPWARCERATIEVRYRVPTLTVPFIGSFGDGFIETAASHTEVVDPYRSGLALDGFDPEGCRA
ncbi:MAG TPA: hypothetical protein VEA78_01060 [Acidimicrobiales bacterium]|nr:hypothetical protein [Acidimicrobiales bacterium]